MKNVIFYLIETISFVSFCLFVIMKGMFYPSQYTIIELLLLWIAFYIKKIADKE